MLYLNKNTNNKIFLSLNDVFLSGLSKNWTIELYSQQNNPVKYSLGTDLSLYPLKYNEFILSGISQADGYYNYNVYNSAYSATTIETGKAIISSSTFTSTVYKDVQTDSQIKYVDTRN
jgi:hypothetical protein